MQKCQSWFHNVYTVYRVGKRFKILQKKKEGKSSLSLKLIRPMCRVVPTINQLHTVSVKCKAVWVSIISLFNLVPNNTLFKF